MSNKRRVQLGDEDDDLDFVTKLKDVELEKRATVYHLAQQIVVSKVPNASNLTLVSESSSLRVPQEDYLCLECIHGGAHVQALPHAVK